MWRYGGEDLLVSLVMAHEIEDTEQDGGRLLHAEDAVEGPFAVKLNYATWMVCWELSESRVGD